MLPDHTWLEIRDMAAGIRGALFCSNTWFELKSMLKHSGPTAPRRARRTPALADALTLSAPPPFPAKGRYDAIPTIRLHRTSSTSLLETKSPPYYQPCRTSEDHRPLCQSSYPSQLKCFSFLPIQRAGGHGVYHLPHWQLPLRHSSR